VLKDPGALLRYHQEMSPAPQYANPPVEIDPTVDAIERVLALRPATSASVAAS
jgi:hypothetical protein